MAGSATPDGVHPRNTTPIHVTSGSYPDVTTAGRALDPDSSWQEVGMAVLKTYVPLAIFVLGLINNVLAVAVLRSRTYRGSSTGFLMTVLALADIGVLSTSASQIWIEHLVGYNVRLHSSYSCKVHLFFTYFFVHLSAWTLTLITLERVVCVCNPLRVRIIFSLFRSVCAWIGMTAALVAFNLHILWTSDLYYMPADHSRTCTGSPEHHRLLRAWVLIDLVLSSLGPFSIILPSNVVILYQIARQTAWRRDRSSGTTVHSCTAAGDNNNNRKVSSTTVMLIVNSLAFIVLTAPATVEIAWVAYGSLDPSNPDVLFWLYLFHALFNLNSCLNFLLYSVSSRKFRRAVSLLSHCEPRSADSSATLRTRCSLTFVSRSYDFRQEGLDMVPDVYMVHLESVTGSKVIQATVQDSSS